MPTMATRHFGKLPAWLHGCHGMQAECAFCALLPNAMASQVSMKNNLPCRLTIKKSTATTRCFFLRSVDHFRTFVCWLQDKILVFTFKFTPKTGDRRHCKPLFPVSQELFTLFAYFNALFSCITAKNAVK